MEAQQSPRALFASCCWTRGRVEFRRSAILPWIFRVDKWMRGQQSGFGEEHDSNTREVGERELVLVFSVL